MNTTHANPLTQKYMQEVKAKLGIESDYALAQHLQVSRTTVSNYSNGRSHFSESVSHRVASILGIPPAIVVTAMELDRRSNADQAEIDTWAWIHAQVRKAAKRATSADTAKIAVALAMVFLAQFLGGTDSAALIGLTAALPEQRTHRIEWWMVCMGAMFALVAWRLWVRPWLVRAIRTAQAR